MEALSRMLSERTTRTWIERNFWAYSHELITAADGWRLALHRLRPNRPVSSTPVALIPGHGTTAWTFFGGEGAGIAGALASAGRDVWVLDPRGCGNSRHRNPKAVVRIADKVGHDLPAFFDHVLHVTKSRQLDAVGHSLGGVFIYLYALSQRRSIVRRAVTLGSPVRIPRAAVSPLLRTRVTESVAQRLGRVPLGRFTERISNRVGIRWMPVHFDPRGIAPDYFEAFLRCGVSDVYGPELAEVIRWVRTGDMRSLSPALRLNRSRLPMPTRFLVGAGDVLTTPESVRHAYDTVGGRERDFQILGRSTGSRHDYRHTDTLIGFGIQDEVTPLVTSWLE